MSFKEKITGGQFVVTAEILPPHGTLTDTLIAEAKKTNSHVQAFNVTDNQRAILHASPLSVAALLARNGLEPIWQLTCRDRNALALQADVLSASILGLENVLAVTGDYPASADPYCNQPVYNLDSVQLLALIRKMTRGFDLDDRPLDGPPRFFLGAAAHPGAEPAAAHYLKLLKKIAAGAEFIQTQVVFSADAFSSFLDDFLSFARANWSKVSAEDPGIISRVRFLAGVFPLKSARQAEFLNQNLPGVKIPADLIKKLARSSDPAKEGLALAARQIRQLRSLHQANPAAAGVHLMTMGQLAKARQILELAGN